MEVDKPLWCLVPFSCWWKRLDTPRFGDNAPPARSVRAYATQRPSGEKVAPKASDEVTFPTGAKGLSESVYTHSAYVAPLITGEPWAAALKRGVDSTAPRTIACGGLFPPIA